MDGNIVRLFRIRHRLVFGPYDEEFIAKMRAICDSAHGRPVRFDRKLGAWRIFDEFEAVEAAVEQVNASIIASLPDGLRQVCRDQEDEISRLQARLNYCERRLASLRAKKKAMIQEDWGIEPRRSLADRN